MKKLSIVAGIFTAIFGSLTAFAGPSEIPLIAGKKWDVGTVYVWNDQINLYIQLELDDVVIADGWGLTEAQVHVGKDLFDFPLNRGGNPKVGHFDYDMSYDCTGLTDPIVLELEDLAAMETLLVAAHASLESEGIIEMRRGKREQVTYVQGAWAEGIRFKKKGNWAMYFEYAMESTESEPCCDLVLDIMSMNPMVPGILSYTFTVCGDTVSDAYSSGPESLSTVIFDAETGAISFTVTNPDGSVSQAAYILDGDIVMSSSDLQTVGFWKWGDCTD